MRNAHSSGANTVVAVLDEPERIFAFLDPWLSILNATHRLGWDPLEYLKLTDEYRGTRGSPRVAAFSRELLLNLGLF